MDFIKDKYRIASHAIRTPRLRRSLMSGLIIVGAFLFIACAKTNSETPQPPPAYPAVPQPPICPGPNCTGVLPGTTVGFYSQTTNFVASLPNNGSVLTPQSGLMKMLKEAMGVCDRDYYDGGLADCQSWISGMHDLVFMMNGTTSSTARLFFRSYPQINPYYNYSYSFPSAQQFFLGLLGFYTTNPQGVFDPMILDVAVSPINNSQGFEMRANGPKLSYGWNKLLQLQVASGKFEDQRFNYVLHFDGGKVAEGVLVRCMSKTCGL